MLVNAHRKKQLHGGGWQPEDCNEDCQAKFGKQAMSFCLFFKKPGDTCLRQYPCKVCLLRINGNDKSIVFISL